MFRLSGRRPLLVSLSFPDARTLIGASSDGEIHVWDAHARRLAKQLPPYEEFRTDHGALAAKSRVALRQLPKPRLIDLDTEQIIAEFQVDGYISETALSDDAKVAAIAINESVLIFEHSVQWKARAFIGMRSRVRSMSFSPGGCWLAASTEKEVAIWSVESRTVEINFETGEREIWRIAWSPDQRWLVGGAENGEVVVWETTTGRQVSARRGHPRQVTGLAVSPDSRVIASACGFEPILLWWPWRQLEREYDSRRRPAMEELWEALGSLEASVAYLAILAFCAEPSAALLFIKPRLIPEPPSKEQVQARIDALDDDDPDVREAAVRDLAALGSWVSKDLEAALSRSPSLEQAVRIKSLLAHDRTRLRCESPDLVRRARAIQVLELIGSETSLEVLRRLVKSPCPMLLSNMADAAIRRLTQGTPGNR